MFLPPQLQLESSAGLPLVPAMDIESPSALDAEEHGYADPRTPASLMTSATDHGVEVRLLYGEESGE